MRDTFAPVDSLIGRGPTEIRQLAYGGYESIIRRNFYSPAINGIGGGARPVVEIPGARKWRAIAIGSQSSVGAVTIRPFYTAGNQLDTTIDRDIVITPQRPWVGEVNGPLTVWPTNLPPSENDFTPDASLSFRTGGSKQYIVNGSKGETGLLHLELWHDPPQFLPTSRADIDIGFSRAAITATTSALLFRLYTESRRRLHLNVAVTAFNGGATQGFCTVIGRQYTGANGAAMETVMLQTTITALNTPAILEDIDMQYHHVDVYAAKGGGTSVDMHGSLIVRD